LNNIAIAVVKSAMIYSCTQPNTIALTFDDGPGHFTEELVDALKGTDIHVTFFINGNNWLGDITDNPAQEVIGKAAADGHQIATHTWAHKVPLTNPEREADINRLADLIEKNAGYRPSYFRAPLGECDDACIAFYESIGYKVIQWDTDTNDWHYAKFMKKPIEGEPQTEEEKADEEQARVKTVAHVKQFLTDKWAQKKESYLVLMHDVQVHTVKEIVPWILKNKPEGYKFVTVAECLGDASQGKMSASRVVAFAGAPSTSSVAPVATPTLETVVPGNITVSNLQNSGAMTVSSNLYIVAALLVYSLYMLL